MNEIFLVQHIAENGCEGIDCAICPILATQCRDYEIEVAAKKWLAEHPETPNKPSGPRRYEIAKAVIAGFASSSKAGDWPCECHATFAVAWADALIAELDK